MGLAQSAVGLSDLDFPDEVSGVRLAVAKSTPPPPPTILSPVLTASDVRHLQAFFQDFEGDALGCNRPPSIGKRESDEYGATDAKYGCDAGMADLIDSRRVTNARWVRERLVRMNGRGQGHLVVVLNLLFGHRPAGTDPAACESDTKKGKLEPSPFRDLAAIVHLTEAVEDERHRMGGRLGAGRAQRTEDAISRASETIAWAEGEIATLDGLLAQAEPRLNGTQELLEERMFWATAGQLVILDARIDAEPSETERDRLDERRYVRWQALGRRLRDAKGAIEVAAKPQRAALERRRKAWLKVIDDANQLLSLDDDAADRAIKTAYAAPTRELSAGDVLRAVLTYHGPANDKAAYQEWLAAKNDFVAKARPQCERLRYEAHKAFADARFA